MKLFGNRRRRQPKVEIIPMVDVILLLLVFYILSSLALSHQHGIPVHLPRAGTGEGSQVEEVVVSITAEGKFFLNKNEVPADGLGVAVERLARDYPGGMKAIREGNIVLNADLSTTHRLVVQAMDQLRAVGVERFAIATERAGSEGGR